MVTEATINKHATALLDHYVQCYTEKYGQAPTVNRYRDRWGFRNMYEDLGPAQAKMVVEYYFKTQRPAHPMMQLFNNYDRLSTIMNDQNNDEQNRMRLTKETEQRVKEWEEKIANSRG